MQVRRVGSLRVLATRNSTPVAGMSLWLVSVEFGEDVAAWAKAGRVSVSNDQLKTDGQGELWIQGMPHGEYRWTTDGGPHSSASGTVVVRPKDVEVLSIEIP
jgi:hypothetical protein